jgi:hypothetical protein
MAVTPFDADIDQAGAMLERRLAAAGHYADPWEIEPVSRSPSHTPSSQS